MSKKITITTKDGITKGIEEWIKDKDKKKESKEFSKLQEKEVIKQRKCLKRRIVKNGISPEYDSKGSKVRFLTDEEIKKEYIMPAKEGTVSERGDIIRELVKFLQQLEGRKVSTDVIVQGIKKPLKSVSSFLSQLFNAGIIVRAPMKDHKRKFVWGISIPYKTGELEAIISLFNDFAAKRRRDAYLRTKELITDQEKIEGVVETQESEFEGREKNIEKIKEQPKISTPSSNTLRIIVEGNIKILFGLAK